MPLFLHRAVLEEDAGALNGRRSILFLLVSYLLLIFILSSVPTLPTIKKATPIDKLAHFIEYGILGSILVHFLRAYFPGRKRSFYIVAAVFFASAYAGLDEFHQYFVPGRDCSLHDFCADFIGAISGSLLILLVKIGNKRAVIDIGSNSVLLLIAERRDNLWVPVLERAMEPRLAENLVETGEIEARAIERSLKVVREYVDTARRAGAGTPLIFATSPLRDASNAEPVKMRMERELGMSIRVLSAADEARYLFQATSYFLRRTGDFYHVEVGGRTTEFIYGKSGKLHSFTVLPLGALRLTEEFNLVPPVENPILQKAREKIKEELEGKLIVDEDLPLSASGGTITTLACYLAGDKGYKAGNYTGMSITVDAIRKAISKFATLELGQLEGLLPFAPCRARVILGGLLIYDSLADYIRSGEITVSEFGVRWGVIIAGSE